MMWTIILITLVLGILYSLALAAAEKNRRFQGAPFTIVQVTIGMLLVLSPATIAVHLGVVRTAIKTIELVWWNAVAVGSPIAVWYIWSFDRVLEDIAEE